MWEQRTPKIVTLYTDDNQRLTITRSSFIAESMPLCNSTKLMDFPSASKGVHIVDMQSFIRSLKFTLLEAYKRKHYHYITDNLSDYTSFWSIWLWDVPEVDSARILLVDSSSWFLERKKRQSLCNYHQTIKILQWNYEDNILYLQKLGFWAWNLT